MGESAVVCISFDLSASPAPALPTIPVEVFVSLNAGGDYHATGLFFTYYREPAVFLTGCKELQVKGCYTAGPTIGGNPVKVTRFNALYVSIDLWVCHNVYPRVPCFLACPIALGSSRTIIVPLR